MPNMFTPEAPGIVPEDQRSGSSLGRSAKNLAILGLATTATLGAGNIDSNTPPEYAQPFEDPSGHTQQLEPGFKTPLDMLNETVRIEEDGPDNSANTGGPGDNPPQSVTDGYNKGGVLFDASPTGAAAYNNLIEAIEIAEAEEAAKSGE